MKPLNRREAPLPHQRDYPEIIRQVVVHQITVWKGEIPAHSPIGSPRISRQKPSLRIIIADRENRVTVQLTLSRRRQGRMTRLTDILAFEALVDSEAKDEGESRGEPPLHLV